MKQDKYKLSELIKTKDVTISLHKRVAAVEIADGTEVNYDSGYQVLERLMSMIGDKPWVYISNRVNSYSLNPNDYKHFNEISTLKGIGVIQYKSSIQTALDLEKMFIKKPFKTFDDLDSAIKWGLQKLNTSI